jgi:hypothetical protein
MSWRRSLSFAEGEEHLLNEFDSKGKSDFAKEAIKFFIKFKDRVFIVSDGLSINHNSKINQINTISKNNVKKFIK